jgi:hypothetical protein
MSEGYTEAELEKAIEFSIRAALNQVTFNSPANVNEYIWDKQNLIKSLLRPKKVNRL